ncbi:hypothetical protein [Psychroserpens sp. Hel_I_66]|uniref:hypothetical protein n=1 Tax=Psychroserpens sp. Hel_I_66 TaxID=1250004 RepID=UPI0006492695|nr:hypothetical protein [Psychroserpens sp. Hel_I_66]
MRFILVLFFLILPLSSFSQVSANPYVKLVEKKEGKRLQLFAVNTDSIPYIVFLRITTEDYRRTSKRPILKEVPANSKLLLKTLILLEGKPGDYEPTFIVNEVTTNLAIRKSKDFDADIIGAKLEKKVLYFTNPDCDLCVEGLSILKENAFNYHVYDIETDAESLKIFKSEIGSSKSKDEIDFPVLKIEDSIYTTIKTRQGFIDVLKRHFE